MLRSLLKLSFFKKFAEIFFCKKIPFSFRQNGKIFLKILLREKRKKIRKTDVFFMLFALFSEKAR